MIDFLSMVKQIKYRVAIYIRLSKEDIDKHEESLSVTNQKNVLEAYVREQEYELYDIYIDDGFTGTNFDRPAFKRMINDIELGKVNMVVTKDLSRLGRDYIETGEYVEKYFPMHNVRYVALLDGIDTIADTSNNDIAPFKAVINDMYSRDNSKKIRTALKTMQRQGKWVGGCPPFGYMVDPKDKNHLVPNCEEAKIVKDIFRYASNGLTYYQIAEKLTMDKVPTSSILRSTNRKGKMAIQGYWSTKTVKGILSNELYLGDMVQNRNSRISYKVRKNVRNAREDWIVVPNTHEPLVDRDTFNRIQKILSNTKIRSKKQVYRALDGLLYCSDCGHKITICSPNKSGYTYIVCNYYRMHSKQHLCTSHSFNYDVLEGLIVNELKKVFKLSLNREKILDKVKEYNDNNDVVLATQLKIKEIDSNINNKEGQLDKMYLDKLDEKITNEMYVRIRDKLTSEINKLKNEKEDLLLVINKTVDTSEKDKECDKLVKEFLNLEKPSRNIMLELINRIEIHKDKTIDIHFNFKKLNFLLKENHH